MQGTWAPTGEPVNADANACAVVDTNALPWTPAKPAGVSIKVLERVNDPRKGRETAIFQFAPGTRLPAETLDCRMELFVLEGSFSDERGTYGRHTWIWNPPEIGRAHV